jgi:protein-S-isoprenylcysteine O-methyltransferase Ste14
MDLIGKTPINPVLFYTGKIAGYACWVVLITSLSEVYIVGKPINQYLRVFSLLMASIGLLLVIMSLINLGGSTRLGVPTEDTVLKTGGLYNYSRNPMYLGFDLWTMTAIFYTWNVVIALLGIFSLITYYFIILGEEKFLIKRFDEDYNSYTRRVRRYI